MLILIFYISLDKSANMIFRVALQEKSLNIFLWHETCLFTIEKNFSLLKYFSQIFKVCLPAQIPWFVLSDIIELMYRLGVEMEFDLSVPTSRVEP